jgi:hypothetical protein
MSWKTIHSHLPGILKTGFETASKEIGQYPPYKTDFFPINYLELFGNFPVKAISGDAPTLTDASYNKEFFTEAFSISKGKMTEPILLSDQILIMQCEEEKEYTDENWETENTTFNVMLNYAKDDPYFLQLNNTLKNISNQYGIPYQLLVLRLTQQADQFGIP